MSKVLEALKSVTHPEHGENIVDLGMITNLIEEDGKISFTLQLQKPNDPMAGSLRRTAEKMVEKAIGITPTIFTVEPKPQPKKPIEKTNQLPAKCRVIAIASGKGGVGKSTVTANFAVTLAQKGYKVGVFDADIYGPSMPKMFGTEDYIPTPEEETGLILPAEAHGIKIMSIGYFIGRDDALVWRGPMATSALKQLIHQTVWGNLDYLLIDLPPGTGDIHLTLVGELKINGVIIVSTPQQVALIDVIRGIKMFQNENINVPILGVVCNMAYFTPAELPNNRYYIFGKGEIEKVAREMQTEILAEIPLVQSIAEGGDSGNPIALQNSVTAQIFEQLTDKVILKLT